MSDYTNQYIIKLLVITPTVDFLEISNIWLQLLVLSQVCPSYKSVPSRCQYIALCCTRVCNALQNFTLIFLSCLREILQRDVYISSKSNLWCLLLLFECIKFHSSPMYFHYFVLYVQPIPEYYNYYLKSLSQFVLF